MKPGLQTIRYCHRALTGFLILISIPVSLAAADLEVVNLSTEHRINPVGINNLHPRMSWQLHSGFRGVMQTARQIRCAASINALEKGPLAWDSGKVLSDESNLVSYQGPEPGSGERIYWQVRVWDNMGYVSAWSEPAFWETGLLNISDWKAEWIETGQERPETGPLPCPFLRKEFRLKEEITRARLYATSHGLYDLRLNGEKVGDQLFTPGWTSYNKRLQYQVYDVTAQLVKGENALGAILGEGWYCGPFGWEGKRALYGNSPALLFQLEISYADGSKEIITSDESWQYSTGPILKSEIYNGEIYDARLELGGWDRTGYNDSDWKSCRKENYGYDNLVACEGPPVRVTRTLKPVRKFITPAGDLVFDMGQNMVGWIKFSLQGGKGQTIIIKHAEVLDREGNFYTDNLRAAEQEIRYTFRGEGRETFEPHFTFQGFRYVKISKVPAQPGSGRSGSSQTGRDPRYLDRSKPAETGSTGFDPESISLDDLEGRVIHSDMEPAGGFVCSDSLLNRLQMNIEWGLRGNFLDVPTDCPQRDERMGWTGDAQVFAPTACFNMDVSPFFTKWLRDLAADQHKDGSVPWVVPMVIEGGGGTGWSDGYGATGWADAAVTIPWTLYRNYGDRQILETQYASMKAWVDYMIRHSGDRYIFDYGFHFGDWLSFAEYYSLVYNAPDYGFAGAHTDKNLIATAYFYHSTQILKESASLLGYQADADRYDSILPKIRQAFRDEFMTGTGRLASNTQTAYAIALEFGLIPPEYREEAAKRLADNVRHFRHLTTGFLGTPLLCQALSDNGYPDIAYNLLFQDKYPSWLYPVTMGATTIWERWDGIKPDSSFQDAGMNSFNHYAYGAIGDWIYRNVAGIQKDPSVPAYRRIVIKPLLTSRLDQVQAWHVSPYGKILSSWSIVGNTFRMDVTIPPNSTARVCIPGGGEMNVSESGISLERTQGISGMETEGNYLVLDLGAGEYHFESIFRPGDKIFSDDN